MTSSTLLSGRYRLDSLLGRGGMGEVHAGFDTLLARKVAIKTLTETGELDAETRARFRREALAAAALDHPFICKVYEVGEHDGKSFIVMEFIDGRTLDALIAEGALTPRQLLEIGHEIAQALEEAHRHGIVHRDLKPSNVMRDVHGHVKVLDFGLAKQSAAVSVENATTQASPNLVDTQPGIRLGTPSYMSPEQVLGSPLDARSDVFSLGVVLHQLASGRHPFLKESGADTMAAILRDPPASTAGDLDVVPGFGEFVHRMLAKACAQRFQTMREVRDALDALRDSSASGTPRSGSTVPPASPQERTPFVARDTELAELSAHLDRMLLGQGGLVLLGGEPGVGKTRLVRELQRIARQRGCVTITGQCYEQEGAPPFGPFVETMEQSVRLVPQAVRAALGDVAAEMTMLAPELRRAFPDIPPLPDIPPEQKRRVLFNSYLTYIGRATQKSATVALLDDLHWADDSSVQLLLHLAAHVASMRILVVGTYRDVDLDAKRPFAKALETLLRQRLATRISLRRLTASGVEQLLTTMAGGARPPESFVRAVYEETEGNPFFVEEVFHHLTEEGRLFDEEGKWKATLRVEDIDVPEGVRLVVSRRVERLGDEARKVLTAAAVVGRSFPLDLLQPVTGLQEDALLDLIEEAERAQLIQAERGREVRYSFVHELIRSTLLGDLSLPRRQRLHVRVADALEERRGASIDAHISMLAHHLYQAGAAVDRERAIAAITRAMGKARTAGAFEDALALADQLVSFDLPPDSGTLAIVEETQADCLLSLGRLNQALMIAEQYLAHSIERRDNACTAAAALRVARIAAWSGRADESIAKVERALASVPPEADRARAEVLTGYATVAGNAGKMAEALAAANEAVSTAEKSGDVVLLGLALNIRGVIDIWMGRINDAIENSGLALRYLEGSHRSSIGTAVVNRAGLLLAAGRMTEVDDFLPQGDALARKVGFPLALWWLQHIRNELAVMRTGNIAAYRAASLELATPDLPPIFLWNNASARAAAFLYGGDDGEAVRCLVAAASIPVPAFGVILYGNLMAVHAWAGRDDEVRGVWRDIAVTVTNASPDVNGWRGVTAWPTSVTALSLIGENAACAALYPTIEPAPTAEAVVPYGLVGPTSSQLALGACADAAALIDRARGHYEEALRLAETLPHRLLQPAVKMWFGRHLAARGADERARGLALLEDAASDFERLGMSLHHTRAVRWLSEARRT